MSSSPSQTSSTGIDESPIVFLDPSEPFVVKPVIGDLLRTRFCVPGSVFLVEAIEPLIPVGRRYRAIRLLLGDSILCIQALLRGDAHGLVGNGEIYAGCYVRVDSFELRHTEIVGGSSEVPDYGHGNPTVHASRKRKMENERKEMIYLLLENLITVGWNTSYLELLESQKEATAANSTVAAGTLDPTPQNKGPVGRSDQPRHRSPSAAVEEISEEPLMKEANTNMGSTSIGADAAPDVLAFFDPEHSRPDPDPSTFKPLGKASQASKDPLPWSSDDPTKPMKLTSLALIPNLPYKQNWMVNVLAVVAALSDVEPSHLPPYHQRTARLADPTTTKQVLLTVFLDVDDFSPSIGSVVLLLGVKNHRFDGGSLKKYASDRPKKGARWWFQEPKELAWCDVARLRDWWDSRATSAE